MRIPFASSIPGRCRQVAEHQGGSTAMPERISPKPTSEEQIEANRRKRSAVDGTD